MKKFVGFLIIVLGILSDNPGFSQTPISNKALISTTNSKALDTVSNTGVRVWYAAVPSGCEQIGIQFDATKISGTVAGTILLVGSNNKTTWRALPVKYGSTNSFTATDVAAQGGLYLAAPGMTYVGIQWTGTGTMSASMSGSITAYK